ncbi:uncharacterized protein ACRADG_007934 [Cochliomyia hominivorax]
MASSVIHPSPPKYLDKELLQTALENYLCCNEVKINKFEVKTLVAGSGENYCSDIYQITMKYQLLDGEMEEQEENVVVKSMPKHKQLVLKNLQIYNRELYFYRNILPKMETIMKIIGKNYILGPRLLYNVSKPIETLIFQNLTPLGFKLQSRQNGLDKIHCLMVLQKLAQYHALSLSLNERDDYLFSNILQRYPFGLLNMDSCKSDAFKALFGGQLLKLIEILKKDSDLKTETINKLDNYYSHFTERVLKSVYPLKGQLNVLNHGDLWVNNLMFCYDSKDTERPKEVRFIDFQLSFYGSLGFDVNYFLNTSVQLDVLKFNRCELIDSYTNTLLQTLDALPYGTKMRPSKEQIKQEIHEKEAYGFFVAFAFFPLMSMFAIDSHDNSLEKLKDAKFAEQKIQLMFNSNKRTIATLKFNSERLEQLGLL